MSEEVRYVHFVVPEALLQRKPTAIKASRALIGKNTFTLNKEVREWMKAFTKDYWYLKENREPKEYYSTVGGPGGHGGFQTVMMPMALLVAFRNPKEAMLFKLTWL